MTYLLVVQSVLHCPKEGNTKEREMCDASSRPAMVSFAIRYCFPFLEVPDVVHRAGLVCQLWNKFTRSDALWKALFLRDTPPMVYAALEEVVDNPLVDSVLAASAGVTLLCVEDRWDAVKWQMLHPRHHHGLHPRHHHGLHAGSRS